MSTPKLPVTSRLIRLLLLAGFFFTGMMVASVAALLLMNGSDGTMTITREGVLITSLMQNIVAFIAPALLLAWLVCVRPWDDLYLTAAPRWTGVVGVVLISLISIPAMNWLTAVNETVTFPEWLSPLENMLRSWEMQALETTDAMLDVTSVGGLIVNILVVGVLTGIGEEMFFRGGVQNFIQRGDRPVKTWKAVWITAFIFSAMHFQFYGFLPRLLLGAYFGYLLVWTRSLWVPVLAHALNNSLAVWGEYTVNIGQFTEESFNLGEPGSGTEWTAIVSVVLLIIIFTVGRNSLFRPRQTLMKLSGHGNS